MDAADPAKLPLAADGTVDEEKLPAGTLVGETEADGRKESHYANGMPSRFQVRG